jgi:phospholipid/cholesterol/gamma-HCH transport system ATP-binding protein
MHTLPPAAQEAIRIDLEGGNRHPGYNPDNDATARHRTADDEAPTTSISVQQEA